MQAGGGKYFDAVALEKLSSASRGPERQASRGLRFNKTVSAVGDALLREAAAAEPESEGAQTGLQIGWKLQGRPFKLFLVSLEINQHVKPSSHESMNRPKTS